MTPPADLEKLDQLVPNWNSSGIPVTTPMARNKGAKSIFLL
jgi:hypothetical protein